MRDKLGVEFGIGATVRPGDGLADLVVLGFEAPEPGFRSPMAIADLRNRAELRNMRFYRADEVTVLDLPVLDVPMFVGEDSKLGPGASDTVSGIGQHKSLDEPPAPVFDDDIPPAEPPKLTKAEQKKAAKAAAAAHDEHEPEEPPVLEPVAVADPPARAATTDIEAVTGTRVLEPVVDDTILWGA
jgi:hypothetical protein